MYNQVGKLIVFEGCDGSGKSTQAKLLFDALEAAKPGSVLTFREPGGTKLGEAVRGIFLDNTMKGKISPLSELMLITASRAQLLTEFIRPALAAGKDVVLDRYVFSTYVYQGIVGGLGLQMVADVAALIRIPYPDIVFYMKIPFEEVQRRNAQKAKDRLEVDDGFVRKVYDAYDTLPSIFSSSRIVSLDGTRTASDLHTEVLNTCQRLK